MIAIVRQAQYLSIFIIILLYSLNFRIFAWQIINPNLFAMQLDSTKFIATGLTYDDVLLVPAYSEILPREVNTATFLTKKLNLMFH